MAFQVAEVNEGLRSVAGLVDIGHEVAFDQDGSYIEPPMGARTYSRIRRCMW